MEDSTEFWYNRMPEDKNRFGQKGKQESKVQKKL